MDNSDIADKLNLVSKLMDIHGENTFKSKSYSIAAFTIDNLTEPLAAMQPQAIARIKGIGESIGRKIVSFIEIGSLPILEELLEKTPPGILEMFSIKGLGPKKIHILWKEFEIDTIEKVQQACKTHTLSNIKGFGAKTEENILQSVEYYLQNQGQFLYAQLYVVFPQIDTYLKNVFKQIPISITGAYARQEDVIDQLEYVIGANMQLIKNVFNTAFPPEIIEEDNSHIVYKLKNGVNLKLYAAGHDFLKTKFITSSTKEFLNHFNETIPFQHIKFEGDDEATIFNQAGISYLPPVLRNVKNFIGSDGSTNKLIQPSDIKGIIHSHSTWSDGKNTIEEMAAAAIEKGFEYLVLSDHSRSAAYAGGLSIEKIQQQHLQIDAINTSLEKKQVRFKIFKSIESDILLNGDLDYENTILSTFDCVIASVHSGLSMSIEKATSRLIKAIENPYTTILGHMTGRLLLSRKGYPLDHRKIIDSCAANDVIIEINANPKRLDMDWSYIPYAIEKGVLLSINPDAHSITGYDDTLFGVLSAQKGGLKREQNFSSFSLEQISRYFLSKKG